MPIIKKVHVLPIGNSISSDGVETFHTGEDLDQLAASYDPKIHEAPVVLGHDSDPDWGKLMSSDKDPAYGWVIRAYREGNDLYVDLDASDELQEFIDKKRYKKRSLGYYGRNSKTNPADGKLYIRHLAMLGSSPPAIKGLSDISAEKTFNEADKMTTPEETKQLMDKNAENWLAFLLKDNGNIVRENIVAFDPKPSEENGWLYDVQQGKWEGVFITEDEERYLFEIKEKDEGGEIEYIVSVKADPGTADIQAEDQATEDALEVADSKEDTSPAEAVAEEDLRDQETDDPENTSLSEGPKNMENNQKIKREKVMTETEYMEEEKVDPNVELGSYDEDGKAELPKQTMMEADGEVPVEKPEGEEEVVMEAPEGTEDLKAENMEYRDDGHVDPDEKKAGMDSPRSKVDAVEDVENAEGMCQGEGCGETEYMEDEKINLEEESVEAMKEELAMLRAKVKEQEAQEMKAREEEMVKFSESLYESSKVLEGQFAKEDMTEFLKSLVGLNSEHMVYGEGDDKKNVAETVKDILSALPEQVTLAEGLVQAKPQRSAVKFDPNYSRGSEERRAKILAIMDERQIDRRNMREYVAINNELTAKEGHYDS